MPMYFLFLSVTLVVSSVARLAGPVGDWLVGVCRVAFWKWGHCKEMTPLLGGGVCFRCMDVQRMLWMPAPFVYAPSGVGSVEVYAVKLFGQS